MKNAHIITKDSVVVVLDNSVHTIKKEQGAIFAKVIQAIETGRYQDIPDIISPKNILAKGMLTFDEESGKVFFNSYELKNNLTERIYQYWQAGVPFEPLVELLRKIISHEVDYMPEELFNFLECNNLPITEDGCFLAYKLTNEDGSPIYWNSDSVRYKVGAVIEMDKEEASRDRKECGGAGLYFGNPHYWNAGEFCNGEWIGRGRMFLVKIDPRHVTAIPRQYNCGKAKCYKMEVVKEFTKDIVEETRTNHVVRYGQRDSMGRFTKNSAFNRDSKGRFVSTK